MRDHDNTDNGAQHVGRRTLFERAEALRAAAKEARAEAEAERERLRKRAAELRRKQLASRPRSVPDGPSSGAMTSGGLGARSSRRSLSS